jgi:tetratricopeptide (TPR) repeat protein
LRQALSAELDVSQRYLVLLFLGEALEGAGDQGAALESLEQAAAVAPRSRAPYLGIARLSRERGDQPRTISSLDRALADTAVNDVAEPLWAYRALAGLRRASLLDELRARVTADRP